MTTPLLNSEKALQSVLYVTDKLRERDIRADFHKIFKIIYFADREHAVKYGRFITGDTYIRMDYGPVPSYIYDYVKGGDNKGDMSVDKYVITKSPNYDPRQLSVSDMEELDRAIDEYGELSMNILTELSHGYAWNSATKNSQMSVEDILQEAGAENDYIKFVCEQIALQKSII